MEEMDIEEEQNGTRGPLRRNRVVSADHEEALADQWARSMALNSEGLEGLIPRARLLLTTGATFFLGFWPLIIITIGLFSATDYYFGPGFVHEAHKAEVLGPSVPSRDGRIAPRVE
ncbi:unnamed protein product [Spirodela intermedia]|uniref:Uncharacterized protein n=1 Tax=Spirodela intermedia TaxID=51605 RepID=A0A7I8KNQ7_SPIIN|nr:unnamed protein product [Spirodela intermedia]